MIEQALDSRNFAIINLVRDENSILIFKHLRVKYLRQFRPKHGSLPQLKFQKFSIQSDHCLRERGFKI